MSATAASGAVALIFLVLGFQIAIFSGNVFKFKKEAATSEPIGQTAANENQAPITQDSPEKTPVRKALEQGNNKIIDYSDSRAIIAEKTAKSSAETFEFNPNTVSLDELVRLGFSQKQAQVILNYRNKGGKFSNKQDFSKMYVVDSNTFARLEPFIILPKLDLNSADSQALLSLKGIGPYYAGKILDYRNRLGNFSNLDQLLEIEGFDKERLDGFKENVKILEPRQGINIWTAGKEELERHPYIGAYAAKGILRFKKTVDSLKWTIEALVEAGILNEGNATKLAL